MADIDNSAWDGQAAMSGCVNSDDPAKAFESICAGKRDGDPSKESTWALPHHKAPGEPPNADGVRNAESQLPKTDGLVNKQEAQAHLDKHMEAIQAAEQKGHASDEAREARRALAADHRRQARAGNPRGGRMVTFPASSLRAKQVSVDGKDFYSLDGYATVFDTPYEMYDMFGVFTEAVDKTALDKSLEQKPDVAFLVNHRGVTMARTTNGTLELQADAIGLKVHALLNAARQDVRDLIIAIDDKNIDQMSFAFMLNDGEWNEEFTEFRITEADINRGDVSAVNYGANPYTSIAARAKAWVDETEAMPEAVRREVFGRMLNEFGRSGEEPEADVAEERQQQESSESRDSSEEHVGAKISASTKNRLVRLRVSQDRDKV